jgi:predicted DNA-binding protein (MmcQ/YjbR family)
MDAAYIRTYCLNKPGVTESFPFGINTLVYKVMEKIFLLISIDDSPVRFNAKCDPDKAIELREAHDAIIPGYHMNKRLWNTIILDGSLPSALVIEMIDDSYNLVVQSLPKKVRELLL